MNSNREREDALDRLLRETLRDDLPAVVERRMKARIDRFQKKIKDKYPDEPPVRILRREFVRRSIFRWLPRSGLAAAGILMIVWGGMLQEGGSTHMLADNISLLRTAVLVKDQVTLSESMTCRMELIREGERNTKFIIKWLPPDRTRIDLHDAQGKAIRTIWMIQGHCTVFDHATGEVTSAFDPEHVVGPYLSAVAGYIHPARLAERLYGEWLEKRREARGECEQRTYRLSPPGKAEEAVEMTVDLCEWLPVAVSRVIPYDPPETGRASTLALQFVWNSPVSPEEMIPDVHRQNQKT